MGDELKVRWGKYVHPRKTSIIVADRTRGWGEVDLFEGQIALVYTVQAAAMTLPFSATDREWDGEVDYVYPTMRAETRTGRVRLAFDNPDLALKPNMYASVEIAASPHRHALAVPTQSIIRTGDGKRVMLALGDGRFRPARVETGLEVDGMTEIVAGLDEGEKIVVSGQFLIDSEASVDASLLRMIGERHDHGDMGHDDMDHDAMDHETMDHETMEDMDHGAMDHEAMEHVDHGAMDHTDHADTASEDRNAGGQQ